MKLTRKQKENLGFSMLISAVGLVITFIVLSCRKRSVFAALSAMALAEGAVGYLLLTDPDPRKVKKQEAEELFSEEECREADAHIRQVLRGKRDGEASRQVLKEIPRDEDATEADFQ